MPPNHQCRSTDGNKALTLISGLAWAFFCPPPAWWWKGIVPFRASTTMPVAYSDTLYEMCLTWCNFGVVGVGVVDWFLFPVLPVTWCESCGNKTRVNWARIKRKDAVLLWSVVGVAASHWVCTWCITESVMHRSCNARTIITFPVTQCHHSFNVCCQKAHSCERLVQAATWRWMSSILWLLDRKTTDCPNCCATMCHW